MRKNFGAKAILYPMPVLIIGTYDENGKPNAMNAAWGGISEETQISMIYYLDGCVRPVSIDFKYNESISGEIYNTYVYEDTEFADDILFCQDIAGTQIIFNMKNVSMLELPLLSVEEAIREYENEIINEE